MSKRTFKVTIEVEETNEDRVYAMFERIDRDDRVLDLDIEDMDAPHVECRIRYVEDWNGEGEHFVYECKRSDEDDSAWGLETAFPLKNDMIHYTALTQIREWMKRMIPFHFAKGGDNA